MFESIPLPSQHVALTIMPQVKDYTVPSPVLRLNLSHCPLHWLQLFLDKMGKEQCSFGVGERSFWRKAPGCLPPLRAGAVSSWSHTQSHLSSPPGTRDLCPWMLDSPRGVEGWRGFVQSMTSAVVLRALLGAVKEMKVQSSSGQLRSRTQGPEGP